MFSSETAWGGECAGVDGGENRLRLVPESGVSCLVRMVGPARVNFGRGTRVFVEGIASSRLRTGGMIIFQ